jgi:Ni/Fe-hydrogenase subunit HybB-like protein
MSNAKPLGGKILTKPFLVCLGFVLVALFFIGKRFIFGIGSVTNMNDGYPWGIWITYDVIVGTALACGGYSMALLVYVANKGEYHPLVRPALLASVFGYTLAGISVFIDLGRYWHMYNIFLPWFSNFHSVMFEVALCIGLYVVVLWIEFAPAFLEKFKLDKTSKKLNRTIFVFIALGILLPTMHQSSLGTLILMAGHKLSPLWWSGFLPLLFLISAITMGYAIVIFESTIASVAFKRPLELDLLAKISKIMPWLLGIYLLIRFEDINLRGYLPLVFAGGLKANMFLLENALILISFLILIYPHNRKNPRLLFVAAVAMLLGGALYRFNSYIIGFDPGTGWHYFPSIPEIMITFGVVAVEVMGYLLIVKKLPVLPEMEHA